MNLYLPWVAAIVANIMFVTISYNESVRLDAVKSYSIGIIASVIAVVGWLYLIRNTEHKNIFFVNILWDVGVTVLCVILPVLMYNIRLDTKAIVGTIIALVGVAIVKSGAAG